MQLTIKQWDTITLRFIFVYCSTQLVTCKYLKDEQLESAVFLLDKHQVRVVLGRRVHNPK